MFSLDMTVAAWVYLDMQRHRVAVDGGKDGVYGFRFLFSTIFWHEHRLTRVTRILRQAAVSIPRLLIVDN